jgi:hypothetical protein
MMGPVFTWADNEPIHQGLHAILERCAGSNRDQLSSVRLSSRSTRSTGPGIGGLKHAEQITLRRLPSTKRQWSKEQALRAIEESPLRFTRNWEQIKVETR